jgi:hypothetical protein
VSIDISHETEARITDEARRRGVSVEVLLTRLMSEREAVRATDGAFPELPVWRLGSKGSLRRRDIYDDVR